MNHRSTITFYAAAVLLCLCAILSPLQANPVIVNIDSSGEGLAEPGTAQIPLQNGIYELGWLNSGVTEAQIDNAVAARDLAAIDAVFNTVASFSFPAPEGQDPNTFGAGLVFQSVTVVDDHLNTAAFNAYKNATTGAAGKVMYVWIRDKQALGETSFMAFVEFGTFPTANDTLNFTDFSSDFTTDSSAPGLDVFVGSINPIIVGSSADTNGGSPSNGLGLNGGANVLQLESVAAGTATLGFASGTATVVENAGSIMVTVQRTGSSSSAVTVQFATTDGSAIAGTDYTATSGTLNFAAGDLSETITVPIANPAMFQGDRTFGITLSNALPADMATIGTGTIVVTIQDDETPMPGTLALSAGTFTIGEGGGTVAVTVRRTGGSDGAVSATFSTTNGTATAPGDYTAANQSVNFASGDSADKVINITIVDDAVFEGNETFQVALTAPTGGATLGAPATGTVTITENDEPPPTGGIRFTAGTFSVSEAAGNVAISAERVTGTAGIVSVQFTTSNGTATAPDDYTNTTTTLTWADGESGTKSVNVPVINNTADEPDVTFNVAIANPTGGAVILAPSTAVVTIQDDDVAGTIAFTSASFSGSESGGTITLQAARTVGTAGAVSVQFASADGTAVAPADYAATTGTLNWANGEGGTKSITVPVVANIVDDLVDQTFTVTLSNVTGGALLGETTVATVTILDDDSVGVFALTPPTLTVAENRGPASFTINRTGGTGAAGTVFVTTVPGTATADTYETYTNRPFAFTQGQANASFALGIFDNGTFTGDRTFTVEVRLVVDGPVLSSSVVTITDNDRARQGRFAFSASRYDAAEGEEAVITVIRTDGNDTDASVRYTTSDGTARAGRDYSTTSGTLFFPAGGSTEATFTVLAFNDGIAERTETIRLKLSSPTGGAKLAARRTAAIRITDDEPFFGITASPTTVAEGGTVTVTVTRSGADDARSVDLIVTPGSAKPGLDYIGESRTLLFDSGVTSLTATFPIIDEGFAEGPETFQVQLRAVDSDPSVRVPTNPITITISRNDAVRKTDLAVDAGNGFQGNNIFNTSGDGQFGVRVIRRNATGRFKVQLTNSGDATDTFQISAVTGGTSSKGTFKIFRAGRDVTAAALQPDGTPFPAPIGGAIPLVVENLPPKGKVEFEVEISTGGKSFTGFGATITAKSLSSLTAPTGSVEQISDTIRVSVIAQQ